MLIITLPKSCINDIYGIREQIQFNAAFPSAMILIIIRINIITMKSRQICLAAEYGSLSIYKNTYKKEYKMDPQNQEYTIS